jgi:hypothetical protein
MTIDLVRDINENRLICSEKSASGDLKGCEVPKTRRAKSRSPDNRPSHREIES